MHIELVLLLPLALIGAFKEQEAPGPPSAATVVQRFVDAANRRDLDGMMATVAPEAVFSALPGGEIMGENREAIRAQYARVLGTLKPGLAVRIARRIEDGPFVVDHEEFSGGDPRAPVRSVIWVYQVRDGLIRRAWRLGEPLK